MEFFVIFIVSQNLKIVTWTIEICSTSLKQCECEKDYMYMYIITVPVFNSASHYLTNTVSSYFWLKGFSLINLEMLVWRNLQFGLKFNLENTYCERSLSVFRTSNCVKHLTCIGISLSSTLLCIKTILFCFIHISFVIEIICS